MIYMGIQGNHLETSGSADPNHQLWECGIHGTDLRNWGLALSII